MLIYGQNTRVLRGLESLFLSRSYNPAGLMTLRSVVQIDPPLPLLLD